jgi:hypothetical protein
MVVWYSSMSLLDVYFPFWYVWANKIWQQWVYNFSKFSEVLTTFQATILFPGGIRFPDLQVPISDRAKN